MFVIQLYSSLTSQRLLLSTYARLITFDHQRVLETLGHGKGLGVFHKSSFLALKLFRSTFEGYVRGGIDVDQNGRFTEDFIKSIRYNFSLLLSRNLLQDKS